MRWFGNAMRCSATQQKHFCKRQKICIIMGFEPEGSWKRAGGTFQPEVDCAAAQVKSLLLRHEKSLTTGGRFFVAIVGFEPEGT